LKAWLAVLGLTAAVAVTAGTAPLAQPGNGDRQAAQVTSPSGPAPADEPARRPTPHRAGELECRNCHRDKHQGVVQMYIGVGGRGTPTIPSHMFQVRVECVACHIAPRADETADLKGQTFRPSERACVNCHGEKFRGMLGRWTATLTRMTEIIVPKLKVARDALGSADRTSPKTSRARILVDDAEFNVRYVSLAKGVHNVFYAADLLKLSNGWLDEATTLLGKAAPRADDQLVRGGYCAALCHEIAKVKVPETVVFGKQRVPHARHVTELGATCTSCHSAESHKAVTATAATCASCHHSPQNERCGSCHRAQAAFYRGETKTTITKVEPNLMAAAVPCTACHDWSGKHSRSAVGERCLGCHDASYTPLLGEWTAGLDGDLRKTAEVIQKADAWLSRARRGGRGTPEAEALLREARDTLALVRRARPAHNPLAADALLRAARERAEAVLPR
jgi:hypothetical protein